MAVRCSGPISTLHWLRSAHQSCGEAEACDPELALYGAGRRDPLAGAPRPSVFLFGPDCRPQNPAGDGWRVICDTLACSCRMPAAQAPNRVSDLVLGTLTPDQLPVRQIYHQETRILQAAHFAMPRVNKTRPAQLKRCDAVTAQTKLLAETCRLHHLVGGCRSTSQPGWADPHRIIPAQKLSCLPQGLSFFSFTGPTHLGRTKHHGQASIFTNQSVPAPS